MFQLRGTVKYFGLSNLRLKIVIILGFIRETIIHIFSVFILFKPYTSIKDIICVFAKMIIRILVGTFHFSIAQFLK